MLLEKYRNVLDMETWISLLMDQFPSDIVNVMLDYHDFEPLREKLLRKCLKDIEQLTGQNYELFLSPYDIDQKNITVGRLKDREGPFHVIIHKMYSNSRNPDGSLYKPKPTPKEYLDLSGTYHNWKTLENKMEKLSLGILKGSITSCFSGRISLTNVYGKIFCE